MAGSFTHLHVHTEFSMLDGASRVGELAAAAAADGQPAMAMTDHGNMYGVLDFYQACKGVGSSRLSAPRPTWPTTIAASAQSVAAGSTTRAVRPILASCITTCACWLRTKRAKEPDPALEPGLPRGVLLQTPGRLGSTEPAQRRCYRYHRLSGRTRIAVVAQRRRSRRPP